MHFKTLSEFISYILALFSKFIAVSNNSYCPLLNLSDPSQSKDMIPLTTPTTPNPTPLGPPSGATTNTTTSMKPAGDSPLTDRSMDTSTPGLNTGGSGGIMQHKAEQDSTNNNAGGVGKNDDVKSPGDGKDDDKNDSDAKRKKRRNRTTFTSYQLEEMEKVQRNAYEKHPR